jgi:hypothetical protein
MDEVRRFMRYVLPGMVFMTEILTYFAFSDGTRLGGWLRPVTSGDTVATAVAVLFGSGAIGFLFANIYHSMYWSLECIAIDHLCLFRPPKRGFRAVDIDGNVIASLSKRDAWSIVTRYIHVESALSGGEEIKGMREITDRLVTITHSIGTTIVATFLSVFAWALALVYVLDESVTSLWPLPLIWVTAIWFLLLVVLSIGYWRTAKALERIANSCLLQRLTRIGGTTDILYVK